MLYPGTADGIIATGFLVAGPFDFVGQIEVAEGTLDKAITRNLDRDDMVTTTIGTFNSMTVHCAALPQSQVRSDHAGGLLQPAGRVRRHRPGRPAVW